MGSSAGSSGKPGFPPQFDALANLVGGGNPWSQGLWGDFFGSTGGFAPETSPFSAINLYGNQSPFAQNFGNLQQQGFAGGDILRQLSGQGTQQAFGNTSNLANLQSMLAGQTAGMNPAGFLDAANSFARGINGGLNTFGSTIGSAQSALADVMDPTAYNSLFQNAADLLTPRVRAAFSARGLGSSGSALEEEGNQLRQLSDSFALRQAQERQQALGTLGQLAQGQGNLGVAGAQTPGQVFQQLMAGQLAGQQGLGLAQQSQLAPLQALGLGGQVFQQGLDMGPSTFNNLLALRNAPLQSIVPLLGGVSGSKQSPQFLSALGIPKG